MTAQEWPTANADSLVDLLRARLDARKWRLLACASARGDWDIYGKHQADRNAIETAERYADALASDKELALAREQFTDRYTGIPTFAGFSENLASMTTRVDASDFAGLVLFFINAAFAATTGYQ